MTVNLKRNMTITIHTNDGHRFRILDDQGVERVSIMDNYHIYFRDVKFSSDGNASAVYLGETDGKLIDGFCHGVEFDTAVGWTIEDGEVLMLARLVSIENGNRMIAINK